MTKFRTTLKFSKDAVRICACALTAALALSIAPAVAGDCKPQTILTTVDMIPMASGRVFVPVQLGSVQKRMLLDTGGGFSEISDAVASELQLPQRRSRITQVDVTGGSTNMIAHAPSFTLGTLAPTDADFIVRSRDGPYDRGNPEVAGILGPNLLRNYDVNLDFSGNKMILISPDHCAGKVVYWPAPVVAVIPMQVTSDGHIQVSVMLDGHPIDALLDTGAARTTLNLQVAESIFRLQPGTSDMRAIGHLGGDPYATVYMRHFRALVLEGISVSNPRVDIAPDLVRNWMIGGNDTTGTRLSGRTGSLGLPDMILGMDILRNLHLYIAYAENKLYVTPASAPDAPAADVPPPAAPAQ
ncbi:MAG TPA: aspartyl protease family protein [Rhizomicrobium sp.]|nr:aspartyl protease family protein [Rhizomicrobium sp.]